MLAVKELLRVYEMLPQILVTRDRLDECAMLLLRKSRRCKLFVAKSIYLYELLKEDVQI